MYGGGWGGVRRRDILKHINTCTETISEGSQRRTSARLIKSEKHTNREKGEGELKMTPWINKREHY